jgi:hypothetical protein
LSRFGGASLLSCFNCTVEEFLTPKTKFMANVFQNATIARNAIKATINSETVVQTAGAVAVFNGEVLFFRSKEEAIRINEGCGNVFSYIYRYGQIELTPVY